ncbi:MAG: phospholipase D family protein [Fuerstiella sp.]
MKISSGRVLDRLPAEEPCLGALFLSYSFDPAFFEDHVLRAVLRLTSDPVEQAQRYHQEARRALQETPVVAIVDAAERRPGRRLPFDLLEVSSAVFHPKAVLLLYRKHARLMIGSGNLTFSGYGGNTELFQCMDLNYDVAADATVLRAVDEHLVRVRNLVRRPGTQLQLFRDELQRRLQASPFETATASVSIVDSTLGPIIEQLVALLPDDAVIHSLGLLAPFYERDDGTDLDPTSVFGSLAHLMAKDAVLDIGVAWENPQVHASAVSSLEEGLGRLWTWSSIDEQGTQYLEHLVPISIGPTTIKYLDETGRTRRWPLDEAGEAIEERKLWMQPQPVAFAPQKTIVAAKKDFGDVQLWLHPSTRLIEGRPVHRPLHAKLLMVGYRTGQTKETLVLMGSPNMSRRALLMPAGMGQGNVEVGVAFRIASSLSIRDLMPELIHAPMSALTLNEREFPKPGMNYALAINEASHDPVKRDLVVTWSRDAANLRGWRLTYDEKALAGSDSAPTAPVCVDDFVLNPVSADVILHVNGNEYSVPILVTDLVALPATPAVSAIGLDELLMLLGRRIGTERAIQIAEKRDNGNTDGDDLTSFFGDGFGPTDVFRAWWAVADDLSDPELSVQAFRLRLAGAVGVGEAWAGMLKAVVLETLSAAEAWFYGAELLRTLGEVELQPTADRDAKMDVLSDFCIQIRGELTQTGFNVEGPAWVKPILDFYTEAKQ